MTVIPVATHGFSYWTGRLEEGASRVRAIMTALSSAHIPPGTPRTTQTTILPPAVKAWNHRRLPPLVKNGNECCVRVRPGIMIERGIFPHDALEGAKKFRAIAPKLTACLIVNMPTKRRFAATANILPLDWQQSTAGVGHRQKFSTRAPRWHHALQFPLEHGRPKVAPGPSRGSSMVLKPASSDAVTACCWQKLSSKRDGPRRIQRVLLRRDSGLLSAMNIKLILLKGQRPRTAGPSRTTQEEKKKAFSNGRGILRRQSSIAVRIRLRADRCCVTGGFGLRRDSPHFRAAHLVEQLHLRKFRKLLGGVGKLKVGDPLT